MASQAMEILFVVTGVLLLAFGRKLFWLFVGVLGFIAGFTVAQHVLEMQPLWAVWIMGLAGGLIGALLALFFQRLAVGVGGFAAGAYLAAHFMTALGFSTGPPALLIGGLIGAILLFIVFDWTLVVLSSLAGATFIVQSLVLSSRVEFVLFLVLAIAGVVFQIRGLNKKPREGREDQD